MKIIFLSRKTSRVDPYCLTLAAYMCQGQILELLLWTEQAGSRGPRTGLDVDQKNNTSGPARTLELALWLVYNILVTLI